MALDPLKQFHIHPIFELPSIFGFNLDFTNSSLFMVLAVLFACIVFWLGIRNMTVVPHGFQSLVELIYNFVESIIEGSCGKEGLRYTGFVLTIFLYVLFGNLVGMLPLPMSYTVTSQLIVTFSIALVVFGFVIYASAKRNKLGFFAVFLPGGTPLWLAPMMVVLEFITYIARPITLSIRLSANMIAGHTIMKVVASFIGFTSFTSLLVSPLSFIFVMVLIVFEIFIAALQAYIFAVLTSVYLNDSLVEH